MKFPICLLTAYPLKVFIFFLLMIYSAGSHPVITAGAAEQLPSTHHAERTPLVSLTIENITIHQAVSLLEEKTGFRIELKSINANERISGQFIETDIETICTSLLRQYNLITIIDTDQRLITVTSIGPKTRNKDLAHSVNDGLPAEVSEHISQKESQGNALPIGIDAESDQPNALAPMTNAELAALHQEQLAEIARDQQNPEKVVPFTDMTNAELNALHQEQNAEIEKELQDPEKAVPFTDMTNAEFVALHQEQMAEIERDQHNPVTVVPSTDRTSAETRALHEEQKKSIADIHP